MVKPSRGRDEEVRDVEVAAADAEVVAGYHAEDAGKEDLGYDQPYTLARRFSTVHHLSEWRISWNIVTSYLESAASNYGLDAQVNRSILSGNLFAEWSADIDFCVGGA